ncbi:MAG: metalloregulator ArsR/SmtB family transcription factor [Alphaproteobacteria bacterium]|nr:metalloregulator ArsR/SmtB family transcription factor [Alphaproteobacteria bacterium]
MANQYLPTVFAALSDPTRFAVVERLCGGPASVGQLQTPFAMATPTFLRHLKVLEKAGLIETIKRGRVRTCTLKSETLGFAESWISQRRRAVEAQLDRLQTYLSEDT